MLKVTPQTKSGAYLHPIGIGTWGYGKYPMFSPGTEAEVAAIQQALELGQNHIDIAEMYAGGGAELIVGQAIKVVSREDIFVASKLWKNHVAKGLVRPAVEAILKRLDMSYLDMLYIHAPWFDAPWQDAIPQIDELIDLGIVRHFGVSNFNADRLREALDLSRHPVAANQMHCSCIHRHEVSTELQELCQTNDITIVAYMPLEKGEVLNNPLVGQVAQKYNATPAQTALAYLLSKKMQPIPKALRRAHIEQNIAAQNLELSEEDIRLIEYIEVNRTFGKGH
jgi:diketogulonate reductase-like aldo/keto reductase